MNSNQGMRRRAPMFRNWICGAPGFAWLCLASMAWFGRAAAGPAEDAVVERWMASATNLVTWQAAVLQTRHLQALTQPLVSTGRVWFAAPNSFRWELGIPPQSLALRSGDELVVLSPRLRRAERHSLGSPSPGPMNDLMALLDAGFPRDLPGFRRRFDLVSVVTNDAGVILKMRPQEASARRMLPALALELDSAGQQLKATEMTFADGSRLRNDFSEVITNARLSQALFRTNLDAGWKVSGGKKSP